MISLCSVVSVYLYVIVREVASPCTAIEETVVKIDLNVYFVFGKNLLCNFLGEVYSRAVFAYRNLARDMRRLRIRQGVRENDRLNVRIALGMLSSDDRRLADEFMALGSWRRVAASRRMAWSTFRYGVLAGFKARFKEAWRKIC